jgi:hypothetical protein
MLLAGSILLLPGLCSLQYAVSIIRNMSIPDAIDVLLSPLYAIFIVPGLLIGGSGVVLIIRAIRQLRARP